MGNSTAMVNIFSFMPEPLWLLCGHNLHDAFPRLARHGFGLRDNGLTGPAFRATTGSGSVVPK